MNILDPLELRAYGFDSVKGAHSSHSMPIPLWLQENWSEKHSQLKTEFLARPGAFDGERACLIGWKEEGNSLVVSTGFRTYTEGLLLKKELRAKPELIEDLVDRAQPASVCSWGMSLVVYVLLPRNKVLAGQRGPKMAANPNVWSVGFTEVLEPGDVTDQMGNVCERLAKEELSGLPWQGRCKIWGLGVRTTSYTWQLIGFIDLRHRSEAPEDLAAAMPCDEETVDWAAVGLSNSSIHDIDTVSRLLKLYA